ncbi:MULTISPECIES: hypothetical protein [unclassified Halomonas]|uniref:hypothetical protein n=1 Tax=unclassified Halomonas TaxID=2609666 RepID=UPI0005540097|nr:MULTISPECIES: hypothetical protein [unclassified Halomonas]CEP33812.1 Putative uncharacterized protein [Halomonas sp. R57-5]
MNSFKTTWVTSSALALAIAIGQVGQAQAYELFTSTDGEVNADLLAVHGWMNSRKNYDGREDGSNWREGFIKYGFSGYQGLAGSGTLYGGLNWVSSATWGDGDAGGNSDGTERRTSLEDAYLGWRSADIFPALGQDGLDFSFGRQVVQLGKGFIINDDGLNLGRGPADGALNRGGAYYLAARHAFDRTAVVRIGGEQGLHGTAAWLKSDNLAQAETELAATTIDYASDAGNVGLTWVHGLDVNREWASDFLQQRDGMDVYSVRGGSDAGIENANVEFEYAWQDKDSGTENAWYIEAGYTFMEAPWTPSLTYRYTRYSRDWDSLFTGLNSPALGTWFQGEVAANYAGPYARNNDVHHLALRASPMENLTLGALFFDFSTLGGRNTLNLDGRELDLYAEWAVNDNIVITPLLGFYKPERSENDGGTQVDGNGTNVYAQLVLAAFF